jgi:hypothetical protein
MTKLIVPNRLRALISLYVIYIVFALYNNVDIIYLLKDIRPILLVLQCWLIYELIGKHFENITIKSLHIIAIAVGLFSFIKLGIAQQYISQIGDNFYEQNSYRYLDAGTYFSAIYLAWLFIAKNKFNENKKLFWLGIIMATATLLIANSRFLILSVILSILLMNYKNIKRLTLVALLGSLLVISFVIYSNYIGSNRVINAFESNGLTYQIESRYLPAFNFTKQFTDINFLFGKGLGEPFLIPWFAYRGDLDPYNINIDSLYVTIYCKFGLLSLLVIYQLLFFYSYGKKQKIDYVTCYLLTFMFIVSATPYQIYSIGVFAGYIIIKSLERKSMSNVY